MRLAGATGVGEIGPGKPLPEVSPWRNLRRPAMFGLRNLVPEPSMPHRADTPAANHDPAGQRPPTVPPPIVRGLTPLLERNIQTLARRQREELAGATFEERLAGRITAFTGSMPFVYLHLAVFGFWVAANLGWIAGVPAWDPSFVILATVASVEAIFLSTFVLISQNREAAAASKRADLDLHISLLAEHEITKLMAIVSAIAARLDVKTEVDPEVPELKQDVAPEAVLDEIGESRGGGEQSSAKRFGKR
jgi:uncharacterized membrane protein